MSRRVVISSLTGEPLPWDEDKDADGDAAAAPAPRPAVIPDRAREDESVPGEDESNDRRLQQDVPPHWGRGR